MNPKPPLAPLPCEFGFYLMSPGKLSHLGNPVQLGANGSASLTPAISKFFKIYYQLEYFEVILITLLYQVLKPAKLQTNKQVRSKQQDELLCPPMMRMSPKLWYNFVTIMQHTMRSISISKNIFSLVYSILFL